VTGHTGFKGSWLALWLRSLGARVVGFSKGEVGSPSLFRALRWDSGLTSITGNVQDFGALKTVIDQHQPEIVFHLAAQSLVRASYGDPVETFATNVIGTVNLLEAVRSAPSVASVVNITSDKCYDNKEWPYAYRENDAFGGKDPYSCSKGCAELVTASYRSSYFSGRGESRVGIASVRAGNVIGGGDWAVDRLVPDCMVAFSRGEAAVIRNPLAIRPWQHVLDALRGYLLLAQSLTKSPELFAKGYNFGPLPTDTQPVSYVAEKLAQSWGAGALWRVAQADSPEISEAVRLKEANFLRLDSSLAYNELNWRPVFSLDQALASTAEWYKVFYSQGDLMRVSTQHLEAFK
jgi:CDP-glucose 4,6-dehydratase